MDLLELLSGLSPQRPGVQPSPMGNTAQSMPPLSNGPQGEAPSEDIPAVMAPHQFRGMFGLHGGLRDILGAVGDAFLVQQGAHPVYAPRQQQEREANAMQHLQDNPMAAVQSLSLVNPEAAREMYHNLIRDQAYQSDRASAEATRTQTNEDRVRAAMSSLGGAANARTWPAIRARLLAMRERNNVDIPDELLPETYSDDVPEGLLRFGTAPGTQMTADNLSNYRTRRLGQIDTHEEHTDQYHHSLVGLGHDRVGVARDAVDVNRGRAGTDAARVAEIERHNRWNEAHPTGRRRAPEANTTNRQMVEGGRYREHGTNRIYHVVNGQKVYE